MPVQPRLWLARKPKATTDWNSLLRRNISRGTGFPLVSVRNALLRGKLHGPRQAELPLVHRTVWYRNLDVGEDSGAVAVDGAGLLDLSDGGGHFIFGADLLKVTTQTF